MAHTPTVSVLLATSNRPDMVSRAIQSVLDQTFQDFELIVVDDGLERRAEDVVTQFADNRITYIKHDTQRGCAGSRVTGINASRGRYIAYLDDDDTWESNKLELQVRALESAPEDVGFSFTAVTQVFDNHVNITKVPDGIGDYYEAALQKFNGFLSVTLMFKRSVFDAVGMPNPDYPSHTDIEYILRVAKQFRGIGINQPLTRVNSKTDHAHMGTDYTNRIRGREMLLEQYADAFAQRPKTYAKHVAKLAWFYRSNAQYGHARKNYLKAFQLHFKTVYLLHYLSMWGNGFGYRLFRAIKVFFATKRIWKNR